jgi:CRISPR/Cas system CSM-associated protein Csm3 (group 7 of RAMP superfamily)
MSDIQTTVDVRLELTITALTPMCVGASGSAGGLADKALQRDAWNRPIIPGSQLKGRVRHSCERIAAAMGIPICNAPVERTMCPHGPAEIARVSREELDRLRAGANAPQCAICAIFGSAMYPSPLRFGDLVATPGESDTMPKQPYPPDERLRPGVGIDRRRGAALENVLYLTETSDEGVVFRGAIQGRWLLTPRDEVEPLIGLRVAGLRLTTRWGGGSSRGLGWASVELTKIAFGGDTTPWQLIEKVSKLYSEPTLDGKRPDDRR